MFQSEINGFLNWKATHAPRASVNYRIWLERFRKSVPYKKLSKVTIGDVVKFQLGLEGKYSPYTVQFAMTALKGLLKFERMRGKSCLPPELIKTKRAVAQSHRAVSEKEMCAVLESIPPTYLGVRDGLMLRMLFDTGVRISELCDMNLTEIDPEKMHTSIITKKSNLRRIIVWSPSTHALLKYYLTARYRISPEPALFTTLYGTRVSPRSVEMNLKRYVSAAGLTVRITPHSFRHGWAHLRRDEGAPLSFIQKGLGHASPSSTFIYEQYHDTDFLERAEKYLRKVSI